MAEGSEWRERNDLATSTVTNDFATKSRVNDSQIEQWRVDGAVLVPDFFTPDELAPVHAEYLRLHPLPDAPADAIGHADLGGHIGRFDLAQFKNFLNFPFAANLATNLLPLHPALIDTARRTLGVDEVFMYQCHTWAKFTGDADYTQEFHFDYGNHTLLVPGDEKHFGTVNYVIYLTDVTHAHGALAYVPRTLAKTLVEGDWRNPRSDAQRKLLDAERIVETPAGGLLIYDTDVYHRGTNLTAPGGHRYSMTVSYRAADFTAMGGNEWARNGQNAPWRDIISNASIDQLAALGIPRPGHAYWTPRTIARVQARYPEWQMDAWRAALVS